VHQIEGVVDLFQGQDVGDHGVDLDLAGNYRITSLTAVLDGDVVDPSDPKQMFVDFEAVMSWPRTSGGGTMPLMNA
jgi:hypothetical protein